MPILQTPPTEKDVTAPARSLSAGFEGSGPGATDGMALIGLLVTDAGRRLRLFSGIGMGVFGAGSLLSALLPTALGKPETVRNVMLTLCVLLLLFSVAVHLFARRREASSTALVRVGLMYVVMAAAAMAVAESILYADRDLRWVGVSGICIWIVLFPLIIPCLPKQALATALAAATTLPVAYFARLGIGGNALPAEVLVKWWGPLYFCAGLSIAAAVSIHRLARSLARAQAGVRKAGRYELVERLTEGGMGQVWRARHVLLPHDVAVKLIRPVAEAQGSAAEAEGLVTRFRREAHAVALLRSPHTVRLFDYGVSESGELFAVMEYLGGFDLQRLVEEHGPLPPARVIRLLEQICLSLTEAHGKGLVHRDVKPANLMVSRLGAQSDFLKVLDFGLVGAMSHAPETLTGEEQRSTVSGTPGYMAPEVLRGAVADQRSDLYAIGVVGYWLLTGTTLFPREGGGEDLLRHLKDEPEDPSERLGKPLPEDLVRVVMRLLAKDPAERHDSVMALRRDLLSCVDAGRWTEEDGDRWWDGVSPEAPAGAGVSSTPR